MGKAKDLTGMVFGRLTAVECIRSEPVKGRIWRCQCSCGGEKEVRSTYLINGRTKSCGCLNPRMKNQSDIAGQRFGLLVAETFRYQENHKSYWLFQCDCGNKKVMAYQDVKWNRVRSCGCLAKKQISELTRKDITGETFGNLIAIRPTNRRSGNDGVIWQCSCKCGRTVFAAARNLRSGRTTSCGCLQKKSRVEDYVLTGDAGVGTPFGSDRCVGVSFDKRSERWIAYISIQKQRYYLGSFQDINSALKTRKMVEQQFENQVLKRVWKDLNSEQKTRFLKQFRENGVPLLLQIKEERAMKKKLGK